MKLKSYEAINHRNLTTSKHLSLLTFHPHLKVGFLANLAKPPKAVSL